MRKLLRLFFRLALFGLVIITGVMIIRTIAFSSRQLPVEPAQQAAVDKAAPGRLAKAITLPTLSNRSPLDSAAFRGLDTLLREGFPLADSLLEREPVGGLNLIFKWPGANPKLPPILLVAHQDVVPVEDAGLDKWTVPPFAGMVQDDYIWGRGALDDKVSIFGIFEAIESLLQEGYAPARSVYLAFGQDEEIRGLEGAGRNAAYFAEKGIRFEYVLDEGSVVLEQALSGLDAPLAMIGITEKGYVSLDLTASLPEGGHSSMPPPETAVSVLSRAISRLSDHPFPGRIDGATAGLFRHVGPEMSLPYRVLFANLWLTEPLLIKVLGNDPAAAASVRTTTAPTMLQAGVKDNVLPTEARATVNFRILPGETVESVTAYVRRTVADPRVTVTVTDPLNAADPSPVSEINIFGFQVIQKTAQQIWPEAVVAPSLVVAATDGRYYYQVSDHVYRFLPVKLTREDLKRIHGVDERISIENYRQMIRFYRQLILNSCK